MSGDPWTQLEFEAGAVFTPGSPISEPTLFSGRLDQISKIIDTISQRGYHAALYGERGVGKTSLSNVLLSYLQGPSRKFVLPRVNCDASDTFTSLWKKLLRDIIVTESRPVFGFSKDEITLKKSVIEDLPGDLTPDDIRRTLAELSGGIILVPVFDEFDRIKSSRTRSLMADTIKSLSDYSVNATIILIGVADSVQDLISDHQSIERALVQVPMPRMSRQEVAAILNNGLGRLKMTMTKDAAAEIVNLSQGLPYVTHLLMLHATKVATRQKLKEIGSSEVTAGIIRSLEQWQESTKTAYYFASKSQQPGNIYKEVILACAFAENDDLGFFSAASVREPLRIITGRSYNIPNFARHLKELSGPTRHGIIERTGQKRRLRYRFNNPLMRPFIVMRGIADCTISKEDIPKFRLTSS